MSNVTSLISSALSSLQASQFGITVASNNISNAQNPEYTRQRLVTTPSQIYGGYINYGNGVEIVRVEAMRDQLIEMRRLQENSSRAGDDMLNRTLSDIEVQFNDTEDSGLLLFMSKFFNSFQTLSADPASPSFREQVRLNANALIGGFNAIRNNLTNVQSMVNRSIGDKVTTINTLARQIARLSGQIAEHEVDSAANELRDQRAAVVKELSSLVDVHQLESAEGLFQLAIGDSRRMLVFGTETAPLSTDTDVDGMVRVMSGTEDITSQFQTGELMATVDVRDNYIPNYLNRLDQLAFELVEQVNGIHSAGYDLNGNTGIDFFQSLAGVDGAASLLALSADVAGDFESIAASSQPTGQDNGVSTQIGNLLFRSVFSGGSITDQYRNLVFQVGTDVSNSEVSLREHEALAQQLELRRQSVSGVSIDEETVQILQFQRAYQASARLLRTVDELTQTILNL
jgi:flagellar hook-associated protein 1